MRPKYNTVRNSKGIVTVTGQDVSLRVRRHQLEICDGFPLEGPQRTRRITRATSRIQRILFLAGSGFITVDGIDWCSENAAPVVAVDQSGTLRWTILPERGGEWWCRLRRAQALAPFTETGLEIARWLVQRKIEGQRDVLRDLTLRTASLASEWSKTVVPGACSVLETKILPRVERAENVPALREVEAEAAAVYWSGWAGLPLHFAPPSYKERIPDHWASFTGRGSPLNRGNRNACDPANALLNYSYALLEAEALLACHAVGLDPYLAVMHTDQDARRSMVHDVIEPVRPVADRLVLNLILGHAFRHGELFALRDSRCRLDQGLCARLSPWMPEFRKALGPVMAHLVSRFRRGIRYTERIPHRLAPATEARHNPGQQRWTRETLPPALRSAGVCRSCGVLIEGEPDRRYCDDCLPARRKEANAKILSAGTVTLRRLRQEGRDPPHTGTTAKARRESLARRRHEAREWEQAQSRPANQENFRKTILPYLKHVTIRDMARATGLGTGYCSMIRRGRYVPHPRHWETLKDLLAGEQGARLDVSR